MRDRIRRQHIEIGDIGQHVQRRHGQHARGHGKGQVLFGILELARRKPDVIPGIHRKQRADHRSADHGENGQRQGSAGPEVRSEVRGDRRGVPADRQAEQDQSRERRRLDRRE